MATAAESPRSPHADSGVAEQQAAPGPGPGPISLVAGSQHEQQENIILQVFAPDALRPGILRLRAQDVQGHCASAAAAVKCESFKAVPNLWLFVCGTVIFAFSPQVTDARPVLSPGDVQHHQDLKLCQASFLTLLLPAAVTARAATCWRGRKACRFPTPRVFLK